MRRGAGKGPEFIQVRRLDVRAELFKMMELKVQELSGYSVSSNILLQDAAFGLEKFLMQLFGADVGWYEEYAFLQGNGVGKPLGILNAPAALKLARNTGSHRRCSTGPLANGYSTQSLDAAFFSVSTCQPNGDRELKDTSGSTSQSGRSRANRASTSPTPV